MGKFAQIVLDEAPAGTSTSTSTSPPAADRIALDRAPSSRTFDPEAGHLTIRDCVISAAGVSNYYGAEIPGWEALRLDPNRTYALLRPANELQRAAATFDGKPLLSRHRSQVADDHDPALVVGSVGAVRWAAPYLRATLTVWDGRAIAQIQDGSQRDLSSGYFYQLILRRGVFGNTIYDGIMQNIAGNHVTLTASGRVAGAVVGDSTPADRHQPAGRAVTAWALDAAAAHRVDMARRLPGIATLKNNRP